jgi:hypothetical protein
MPSTQSSEHVCKAILSVADLTDNNPNVFFGVGLAQALGNDLLLISHEEEIPFDIANEHTIVYKSDARRGLPDRSEHPTEESVLRAAPRHLP